MSYFDQYRVFHIADTTSRIDFLLKALQNFRTRSRNRKTVTALLKKQDNLLHDMGIERDDIQDALDMKGDASENLKYLIREKNGNP